MPTSCGPASAWTLRRSRPRKALIRQRYPDAHFGDWGEGLICRNLPAWESPAVRLRYEPGETEDKHKPVAYVRVEERTVTADSAGTGREQKRRPS